MIIVNEWWTKYLIICPQVLKFSIPAIITYFMYFHHYQFPWKSKQKEKENGIENILFFYLIVLPFNNLITSRITGCKFWAETEKSSRTVPLQADEKTDSEKTKINLPKITSLIFRLIRNCFSDFNFSVFLYIYILASCLSAASSFTSC